MCRNSSLTWNQVQEQQTGGLLIPSATFNFTASALSSFSCVKWRAAVVARVAGAAC